MSAITMEAILQVLNLAGALNARNDKQFWKGGIETSGEPNRPLTVTAVSLEITGLHLTVQDGDKEIKLADLPLNATHTKVLVNGERDVDAAMVFAVKGSPGNPTRFAFDFRRVTLEGKDHRLNFRYDP